MYSPYALSLFSLNQPGAPAAAAGGPLKRGGTPGPPAEEAGQAGRWPESYYDPYMAQLPPFAGYGAYGAGGPAGGQGGQGAYLAAYQQAAYQQAAFHQALALAAHQQRLAAAAAAAQQGTASSPGPASSAGSAASTGEPPSPAPFPLLRRVAVELQAAGRGRGLGWAGWPTGASTGRRRPRAQYGYAPYPYVPYGMPLASPLLDSPGASPKPLDPASKRGGRPGPALGGTSLLAGGRAAEPIGTGRAPAAAAASQVHLCPAGRRGLRPRPVRARRYGPGHASCWRRKLDRGRPGQARLARPRPVLVRLPHGRRLRLPCRRRGSLRPGRPARLPGHHAHRPARPRSRLRCPWRLAGRGPGLGCPC